MIYREMIESVVEHQKPFVEYGGLLECPVFSYINDMYYLNKILYMALPCLLTQHGSLLYFTTFDENPYESIH